MSVILGLGLGHQVRFDISNVCVLLSFLRAILHVQMPDHFVVFVFVIDVWTRHVNV